MSKEKGTVSKKIEKKIKIYLSKINNANTKSGSKKSK